MKNTRFANALLVGMLAVTSYATADETLGGSELTKFGAIKAGNAAGTIPEYTNEPLPVPDCYDPAEPNYYCDPWNDEPLFTITSKNMGEYAEQLTEGQKALFSKYPEYRMDVYPTRRTARFPEHILENSVKNQESCRTINDGLGVEGCYGGVPFPIPKTGNEVMWNHLLKFSAVNKAIKAKSILVDDSGRRVVLGEQDLFTTQSFFDPKINGPMSGGDLYYAGRLEVSGPARRSGEKIVISQSVDGNQRAYQYLPGQRRVKLAPDLAYDTPSPSTGGISTMDQEKLFFGKLDRYDFKLIGKEEKFLNYNNFMASDYKNCPEEKYFTKNYPNPECTRWELHRVWHVEATLKPGFRHILPTRHFYFDEDMSFAGTVDNYDSSGEIYRVDNAISYPFYVPGYGGTAEANTSVDVRRGSWSLGHFSGFPGGGQRPVDEFPSSFYTPESMAGQGIR